MKNRHRTLMIKYLAGNAVCLLLSWFVVGGRVEKFSDLFAMEEALRWHILCDAFFLPGMLYLLGGALMVLGNLGAMDAMGYMFHVLVNQFLPTRTGKVMTYFDYVQEKKTKRSGNFAFLLVIGIEFLAISGLFLMLYLND